jgi:hypothetical protein
MWFIEDGSNYIWEWKKTHPKFLSTPIPAVDTLMYISQDLG